MRSSVKILWKAKNSRDLGHAWRNGKRFLTLSLSFLLASRLCIIGMFAFIFPACLTILLRKTLGLAIGSASVPFIPEGRSILSNAWCSDHARKSFSEPCVWCLDWQFRGVSGCPEALSRGSPSVKYYRSILAFPCYRRSLLRSSLSSAERMTIDLGFNISV